MTRPSPLSNLHELINLPPILERHGPSAEGYDRAVQEATDTVVGLFANTESSSIPRDEIVAAIEDLILRLAFLRLASSRETLTAVKEFFIEHSPHDVANFTKFLFGKFGPLKKFNFQ